MTTHTLPLRSLPRPQFCHCLQHIPSPHLFAHCSHPFLVVPQTRGYDIANAYNTSHGERVKAFVEDLMSADVEEAGGWHLFLHSLLCVHYCVFCFRVHVCLSPPGAWCLGCPSHLVTSLSVIALLHGHNSRSLYSHEWRSTSVCHKNYAFLFSNL